MQRQNVLVCGATGYVGGRLVPRLLDQGYEVTCLVRSPEKLSAFEWRNHPRLTVIHTDLENEPAVRQAAQDCTAAYYLVHSMISAGQDYAQRDRELASSFARAMRDTQCRQIIYLGGLGELGSDLSHHLQSRREVAEVLRESGLPVTEFRAAMIIGSGSASFEILRYLVDRLPIMITPKWVRTETQPIAIRDVLRYLVECLSVPETIGRTLDIGGEDVLTFRELMEIMAEESGLPRRIIIPVPVLTPRLSSGWISLVTPVNGRIARPLAEGLKNRTVCRDDAAQKLMPGALYGVRGAIDAALGKWRIGDVETRWSTAGEMPHDPEWSGGTVFQDCRERTVDAPAEHTFRALARIGGSTGYWGSDWMWKLRGYMDKFAGGPGLRRGRRHPSKVSYGEAIDFWRVSGYQSGVRLRLRAEMKLPGVAELEFHVEPETEQTCHLRQTARFRPLGLAGLAYWYMVLPFHSIVFPTMINGIAKDAKQFADEERLAEEAAQV